MARAKCAFRKWDAELAVKAVVEVRCVLGKDGTVIFTDKPVETAAP